MTAVLTASAVLFGALAYRQLPVNDLPAVDYPVIQVNVGYPGASPETVAANIATPLERQFMQIPGLSLTTSKSTQGFCSLTLQFDLSKSVDAAATDVQAAISRATGSLPADLPSPPTFVKTNPNDQPILYIALTSDSMTKGQLYSLADTQIGQRISIVNGVSQVVVYGTKSAIRIKADPSALASRGLTMDDLAEAIRQGTSYQGAGQMDGANRTFLLQPRGQLDNAEAYGNLIVGRQDGWPIYLRDVATAEEGAQDERVKMNFWVRGKHVPAATVVLAVFRQAGSNAVAVAQAVKALLPEVAVQLPGSVSIVPINDRSQSIVNSVNDVQETLIIAFVLVVLVIYVFLGRARDTLIPVVAMPLSLLLTFLVMNLLDYSLDNLSLLALTLAVGFLVDDAIVFLENTVRRMEQTGEAAHVAAIHSVKQISFTILSMTLSLAAVFMPLVFMSGLIGRIFREFAVTIIVAIIASGVVSLTLTPLMCARMLQRRGHDSKKTWMERVVGGLEKRVLAVYGASLWYFLRQRWISLLIWIACMAGTVYLLMIVPKAFLPIGDSSFIWGVLIGQEGVSPERVQADVTTADSIMQKNEAVNLTFTMSGSAQFLPSNFGLLLAFLKPPREREPIAEVSKQLAEGVSRNMPGAIAALRPMPVIEISTGAVANLSGQYSYSISGIDPQEVYAAGDAMMGRMMASPEVFQSVVPDVFRNTPSLRINILRDQAASYGVSAARIETLLRNAYSQNYVYLIKRPEDQYEVILEVADAARRNPEDLGLLYVRSDDGQRLVPISAVASWEVTTGPQAVNHLNQFASVTLSFGLQPGVPLGTAVEMIEAAAKEVVPPQLRAELQGEAMTFRETMKSLLILMVLAVFVMYVILAILYESYLHPLTVLSTLPTAMVGGLAALVIFREEASLYAFIGLFMLMGIVKKNGIMIVDFAIQRVARGESAEIAIHDASMDRFRPIIMTTLAALMGAIPIALGWGADGASRRPLGIVIVGGLIVSQMITLYITPAIYLYFEVFQEKVLNRIPFFAAHYEGHVHLDSAEGQESAISHSSQVAAGLDSTTGGWDSDSNGMFDASADDEPEAAHSTQSH